MTLFKTFSTVAAVAFLALPGLAIFFPHSVGIVVSVPQRTMRLVSLTLAGISALLIYFLVNGLKVRRINAATDSAFVVQFFALWNRPDVKLIADSVGAVNGFPDAELSIPPRSFSGAVFDCDRPSPQPASSCGFWRNMRKKSFENANLGFRHGMTLLWSACSGLHEAGNFVAARFYFTSNFHVNTTKGVL